MPSCPLITVHHQTVQNGPWEYKGSHWGIFSILHVLAVCLWASCLSSLHHSPIAFLVQEAHFLSPELLVALVLVDAVAAP